LSHQRGTKPKINPENKNKTIQKKKFPSSNAIHFQLVLQHPVLVLSLSHQRKRKIKQQQQKESGDSFVNVCLRLGLTCHLLSTICWCRLYLCRSQE
jgi:hypothetical protein